MHRPIEPPLPRTAVLAHRQRVGVDDVSRTGCRLTGTESLDVGTIGVLAVNIAGEVHVEVFRVARACLLPGEAGLCQSGVEFLPMPAGAPSLHDLAAHLDDSHSI